MVRRPLRGSVRERLRLSRLSLGEQTEWWRLPAPCAPLRTLSQRSRARSTASRGSLVDSFEIDVRGKIPMPLGRMKPGRRAGVIPARPGPGGR